MNLMSDNKAKVCGLPTGNCQNMKIKDQNYIVMLKIIIFKKTLSKIMRIRALKSLESFPIRSNFLLKISHVEYKKNPSFCVDFKYII
jgi:hypothetical protein